MYISSVEQKRWITKQAGDQTFPTRTTAMNIKENAYSLERLSAAGFGQYLHRYIGQKRFQGEGNEESYSVSGCLMECSEDRASMRS
ncbi:MAG: hypothetical protein H6937_09665 [Burkholderiales bacterium]|nr:hypothetical protein [Burkholderiales bacterium]